MSSERPLPFPSINFREKEILADVQPLKDGHRRPVSIVKKPKGHEHASQEKFAERRGSF